jgi:amino acid transporter|uniref:APC family permease n=1 Tax=Candidatus Aramenus sulfurataquae TaxID=1326980 RepID=A0A0F2LNU1_9CREN|nr:APC family permease [Candidatus Aramenus sulfurataquae]
MVVSKRTIFVRESSGLIKQVNLLDAVMLNIGNMSAGVALFESISPYINSQNNPTIGGPGGVLWIASLIGLALAIPQLILYTTLNRRIARTGGDYVWISRSLSGGIGATMALALMVESLAYFALVAFFSVSSVNAVLCTIGGVDHSSTLLSLASNVFVNPYGNPTLFQKAIFYLIGAVFFGLIIALNVFRAKWGYNVVTALGIFSFATLAIAMVVIAASSPFQQRIEPFLSAEGISVPQVPYAIVPKVNWAYTLLLLPIFALYTYPWMQAGPAVSAEFKNTQKVAKLNLLIALAITGFFVTVGFLEMDAVAGYYFNYYAYGTFVYNFWDVAIALASNPALQWLIGLGAIVWNFYVLSYGVIVFSRYIFALSFDRVLPEKLSEVNKYGSPVYAHLLDLIVTLGLLAIPVFSTSAAVSLYGATILGALYFAVVSVAGLVYGVKNNLRVLQVAGGISAVYFAFLTYEAAVNPVFGFFSEVDGVPLTIIFVVGVLVLGALVYLYSKHQNAKRGIDVSLAFKEIPPE